ncbi:MAG: Lrp/AsnC family transcriptional regulator [Alphaproteobacteria bacterium]|nr:Lrp/AsnC family transcriptional regulator [Alphaproteobacteria bacterium]
MIVEIDELDRRIVSALQRDSRISYNSLAKLCGASTPTVVDRVRRLEDLGVIQGYGVSINRHKLGWGITALIRLSCGQDQYQKMNRLAQDMSEIVECYHVTGEDAFHLKVTAKDIAHLETLISRFSALGRSASTIVLSTVCEGKQTPV